MDLELLATRTKVALSDTAAIAAWFALPTTSRICQACTRRGTDCGTIEGRLVRCATCAKRKVYCSFRDRYLLHSIRHHYSCSDDDLLAALKALRTGKRTAPRLQIDLSAPENPAPYFATLAEARAPDGFGSTAAYDPFQAPLPPSIPPLFPESLPELPSGAQLTALLQLQKDELALQRNELARLYGILNGPRTDDVTSEADAIRRIANSTYKYHYNTMHQIYDFKARTLLQPPLSESQGSADFIRTMEELVSELLVEVTAPIVGAGP
ncbi:hypothetical protein B0H16DRAFT_1522627 [Mycena metata]|uniref:Zn(2)-C6 fungal-type domain-containing protein n=1 Tax=Mycena metata TaxID=1033252 RepID=A0AAD7JNN4_9AGAR|nr:hypothetical protein B0H16DRAFT_1522627 [Mycena metata]